VGSIPTAGTRCAQGVLDYYDAQNFHYRMMAREIPPFVTKQ
jgi:hypothetical protein